MRLTITITQSNDTSYHQRIGTLWFCNFLFGEAFGYIQVGPGSSRYYTKNYIQIVQFDIYTMKMGQ